MESIAEYALVIDGKFTNGTFQATSYIINPEDFVVAEDWIQVPRMWATCIYSWSYFLASHDRACRALCTSFFVVPSRKP